MKNEDFDKLKKEYKVSDICVTNARGFWEKAPTAPSLWMNVGTHKLIKEKDAEVLKAFLDNKDVKILCIEPCYKHWVLRHGRAKDFIENYCPLCKYDLEKE